MQNLILVCFTKPHFMVGIDISIADGGAEARVAPPPKKMGGYFGANIM